MEYRKRVRHRLGVDAVFTWEGADHTLLYGEGVTRDLSPSGAYIFSLTCPPVGGTIQLEVLLLPLDGGLRTVRFKTVATVIRVEHANAGGDEGFAVVLEGLGLTEGGKVPRFDQ
ncbi:MAG: hypothetical protein DMG30_29925 [Acidobacteria bacterium]|nr:MAG: hypothetical protein DMG30_29925 [Acidobacteriota bacterium]